MSRPARATRQRSSFPSSGKMLGGFVGKPQGPRPFTAILYNHGSEEVPSKMAGQALFFVPRGFVLLVPRRRGQGLSKDAGAFIDAFVKGGAPGDPQLTN